jgi:hypothetical protein
MLHSYGKPEYDESFENPTLSESTIKRHSNTCVNSVVILADSSQRNKEPTETGSSIKGMHDGRLCTRLHDIMGNYDFAFFLLSRFHWSSGASWEDMCHSCKRSNAI